MKFLKETFLGHSNPFIQKVLNFAIPFFLEPLRKAIVKLHKFLRLTSRVFRQRTHITRMPLLLSGRWSKIKSMADYRDAPASEPVVINDNGC